MREGGIGHERGRVVVEEHDFDAFVAKGEACLRPRIVEFRRLTDDDGAGSDEEHLADGRIARHGSTLPPYTAAETRIRSAERKLRTRAAPGHLSPGRCRGRRQGGEAFQTPPAKGEVHAEKPFVAPSTAQAAEHASERREEEIDLPFPGDKRWEHAHHRLPAVRTSTASSSRRRSTTSPTGRPKSSPRSHPRPRTTKRPSSRAISSGRGGGVPPAVESPRERRGQLRPRA